MVTLNCGLVSCPVAPTRPTEYARPLCTALTSILQLKLLPEQHVLLATFQNHETKVQRISFWDQSFQLFAGLRLGHLRVLDRRHARPHFVHDPLPECNRKQMLSTVFLPPPSGFFNELNLGAKGYIHSNSSISFQVSRGRFASTFTEVTRSPTLFATTSTGFFAGNAYSFGKMQVLCG